MNMNLLTGRKKSLIVLLLYWVALFIFTHIPVAPELLSKIQASDKKLHFIVFFVLSFLFFNSIGSAGRIDWKRKINWLFCVILVVYAAGDEYLQGPVGRNVSFADFLANLAGITAGLIIMSFFEAAVSILIILGLSIPVLTTAAQLRFEGALWFVRPGLYFVLFGLLTYNWTRFFCRTFASGKEKILKFIRILSLPIGVLFLTAVVSAFFKKSFGVWEIFFSCLSITAFVFLYYRKILPFNRFNRQP